jgi:oligopeptide/dipeptide ABC transporter ATP-binding protein
VLGRVVGQVRAVDGVSFDIGPGETLGLVGESGCGKTTVGRCILRLAQPTAGRILFDGHDVTRASASELTRLRRDMQVIFQDPFSSLNPRMRVIDLIGEALEVHGLAKGAEVERRVADLLRRVGLSPSWINRYPHEFSGGQRQRIGVARAIALGPKLVVCDEAVSALDVSIQAQVINLLIELRRDMNLSYLFIAHDLSVVRHVSHRIAVMYLGQLVEVGPSKRLFQAPAHPYTRALLSAIPLPVPGRKTRRLVLHGDVPTPLNPPSGCRFHTRCPAVRDQCRSEEPPSVELEPGHTVKCVYASGLGGDAEWSAQMTERIDRAMAENAGKQQATEIVSAQYLTGSLVASEGRVSKHEGKGVGGFLGIAFIGLGALVASSGSWAAGGTMMGLAHVALVRPRATRRGLRDAILLAALAVSVLLGMHVAKKKEIARAQTQRSLLMREIDERLRIAGAYPRDLSELGWRLYPIFEKGRPVDPWGRPWRFRVPGAEGRPFDLGSTGRDGAPSADDIGDVPR